MANKFKVGDRVIVKSKNEVVELYKNNNVDKIPNIEYFNDFYNTIGIISYMNEGWSLIDCGKDKGCMIPNEWLEKYGSVEHVKNIIKTADEIFAKKYNIEKISKEIEKVTEKDSLTSEIKEKKVIAERMSPSEIERSRNTFFSALSDDDIQEVNKKSFDASKIKRVNECLDSYYNIIKSFTVINKTKYKFNPDYLLNFFVSECGFDDYYAKKYIDLYKNCGLKCDDVCFSFSEAKKMFVEVDNIGKICEIANLVIVSEKFEPMKNSESDGKKEENSDKSKILEIFDGTPEKIKESIKDMSVSHLEWIKIAYGKFVSGVILDMINETIKEKKEENANKENNFNVGDTIVVKSKDKIIKLSNEDNNFIDVENYNEYYNQTGKIHRCYDNFSLIDFWFKIGELNICLLPNDWIEKCDSVEYDNNIKKIYENENLKNSEAVNDSCVSSCVDDSDETETDKECTISDLVKMGIDVDLANGGVEGLKKTAEKMSPMEIDYLRNTFFAELSDDEINEIINKKRERLNNSINDGAKIINRIKECKLLESSNEMYENTKKELESKRCCESDEKIDGRIEMINNAQRDVISRYKKLIDNENSCDFCFEEWRSDVGKTSIADSTHSFDCTASTLSNGILCRTNGIHEYFAENGRLMCHNFLVELPERYGISCFNIDNFFIDRENKTVSMTVYEKEDGEIIRKLISELRFGVENTERNTDENDICVYHYNNRLKIAYKEVFRYIKLDRVVDDALTYNSDDEFFAHHVTFRYNTDFIEDNDVVPTNASFIIEKHKKLNNK